MNITAATRTFALLGDPVAHSLSPVIQNAAFAAAGIDAVYVALRSAEPDLPALMRTIGGSGGGNITVPHKAAAAAALDNATEAVRATGACNTFWVEDGKLCGDSTDVAGFIRAMHALGVDPRGADVLVLGAGGAAAAVVHGLQRGGARRIFVHNRTHERAVQLAERLDPDHRAVRPVPEPDARRPYDFVVNTTTLGLHPDDPQPYSWDHAAPVTAALDLVYAPGETEWVRCAREKGVVAADGKGMLLAQAAAAFERWFHTPAPIDAMRAAIANV